MSIIAGSGENPASLHQFGGPVRVCAAKRAALVGTNIQTAPASAGVRPVRAFRRNVRLSYKRLRNLRSAGIVANSESKPEGVRPVGVGGDVVSPVSHRIRGFVEAAWATFCVGEYPRTAVYRESEYF